MGFGSRNCGYCLGINTVSKTISNNILKCVCRKCGEGYPLSLLKLEKKLIYLDQNFLSEAFKNKLPAFIKRADHLNDLSRKQLIICPYSEVHDIETHLYEGNEKRLWDFIRHTSFGEKFKLRSQIELQQLVNAYIAYCNNQPDKSILRLSDAIPLSVHNWHDSLMIDINWSITQSIKPKILKKSKDDFIRSISEVIQKWQKSKSSLEDDYNLETRDHANIILQNYLTLKKENNVEKILESSDYRIMNLLLEIDVGGRTPEERCKNVLGFLKSSHFANIPYINISSGLWALIKQQIKKNQFSIKQDQLQGIPSDIDHLSMFAPYCDAVFTEKTMARLLTKWCSHSLGGYPLKVFSAENWEDFDSYLDNIENNMSLEMKEELEIVYS